eukprot:TRINITY_DN26098_c0_g1_i1.p1 TRINITY_DN26098_c0_g1~~TRINITY_DN26098_c0_g1_i1.p1  ORF type:complete len:127 (-),score=8.82 TRINITY_DN26098_c0_g1_i1:79-459(-)
MAVAGEVTAPAAAPPQEINAAPIPAPAARSDRQPITSPATTPSKGNRSTVPLPKKVQRDAPASLPSKVSPSSPNLGIPGRPLGADLGGKPLPVASPIGSTNKPAPLSAAMSPQKRLRLISSANDGA